MRRALGLGPLGLVLLASDVLLIALGFWLSSVLRRALPYGQPILPGGTSLPWVIFVMAGASWIFSMAEWGAYDQRRILRWYQEFSRVSMGGATGSLLLAGMLYLSFREVSRLQFFYSSVATLALILAARAGLRLYYRAVGRSRPGWRNRVLIVGAGDLGQRAARIVLNHSRWGYTSVTGKTASSRQTKAWFSCCPLVNGPSSSLAKTARRPSPTGSSRAGSVAHS